MAHKIYKVIKPLTNLQTNEEIPVGTFIEMDPELAEPFIKAGAFELTRKKTLPTPNEENELNGNSDS